MISWGSMKTLKLWNGPGGFRKDPTSGCWIETGHCYLAAFSKVEAVALMHLAGFDTFTRYELEEYYIPVWGIRMAAVKPVRGVWAARPGQDYGSEKPVKLI